MKLSPEQIAIQAANIGARMARRVFEARGNHTEAHLREDELAALMGTAYEIGLKNGQEAAKC